MAYRLLAVIDSIPLSFIKRYNVVRARERAREQYEGEGGGGGGGERRSQSARVSMESQIQFNIIQMVRSLIYLDERYRLPYPASREKRTKLDSLRRYYEGQCLYIGEQQAR